MPCPPVRPFIRPPSGGEKRALNLRDLGSSSLVLARSCFAEAFVAPLSSAAVVYIREE